MDVETGILQRCRQKHKFLPRCGSSRSAMLAFAVGIILLVALCATLIQQAMSRTVGKANAVISVTSLALFDTSTNEKVVDLVDGMVIDLDTYDIPASAFNFTIEAIISDISGSLLFGYNENKGYRVENFAPMTMCGDMHLNYSPCPELSRLGSHEVTVTPYSEKALKGIEGTPIHISYSIVSSSGGGSLETSLSSSAPASTSGTTQERSCPTPKFGGDWEWGVYEYPVSVAEAQGGRIGDDLVVIGGFKDGYEATTTETFALNMINPDNGWQPLDSLPVDVGVTHGAFALIGDTTMAMCGGYTGGNLGKETDICFQLDSSKPRGQQWTIFDSLPEGRAGGGLIYDSALQQLVYTGGAQRPMAGVGTAIDFNTTWIYDFQNPAAGWTDSTPLPFHGNHMSFVTAKDNLGDDRHFIMGGQEAEDEANGNTKEVYEWDGASQSWIEHPDMPFTRGHAASATKAISCGFILAGGTTNDYGMVPDVSYYDVPSGTWTRVGELPSPVNTVVCDIGGGYLYCETGWATGKYSARRKIGF